MKVEPTERAALRTCARICWLRRAELNLNEQETEQALIAWMHVGTDAEAEAASEVLAARRAADAKQATFDRILST